MYEVINCLQCAVIYAMHRHVRHAPSCTPWARETSDYCSLMYVHISFHGKVYKCEYVYKRIWGFVLQFQHEQYLRENTGFVPHASINNFPSLQHELEKNTNIRLSNRRTYIFVMWAAVSYWHIHQYKRLISYLLT